MIQKAFFGWTLDAFDFFSVSLSATRIGKDSLLIWDIANLTKANQNIYPAEDFGVQPSDVTSK